MGMSVTRQVVQSLLRRPWYSTAIVTVMAVACALLTSVLAIVDGVLFKPLGYPGERNLVAIMAMSSQNRTASASAEDLAAWAQAAPGVVFTGFHVHSSNIAVVQANFFDLIGVRPALGGFIPEDFGARPLIEPRIVTDQVFRSQFDGDPAAIGRIVIVDPSRGSGYRVVGVMPRGFTFPVDHRSVGYLTPYIADPSFPYYLSRVIARTPPEVRRGELEARVLAAATPRNATRSGTNSGSHPIDAVVVEPLGGALGAASRPLFMALLVAAGLLVAIAALNASSLMAARSVDRRRELAVRRALGATASDIRQLLLTEAALLVVTGAAIGLLIAVPLLRFTAQLLPDDLALFRSAAIDWRVAAFTLSAAAVLTTVVGLWPLRVAHRRADTRGDDRSVTAQARSLSRRLVVTVQVALALVLTVGGSLLVGSLLSVYAQTPPITTGNVLTIAVQFLGMPASVAHQAPERMTRVDRLLERVRTVPGVDAVALTAYDLLDHAYQPSFFLAPATARNPRTATVTHAVTADFYRILEPQLVAGRWPTVIEFARNEPVIVVSEGVASNYWPNASAIGQTLTDGGRKVLNEPALTFTVVGVVKEVHWAAWDERPLPTIYGSYALLARQTNSAILIRTSGRTSQVAADTLRVLNDTDALVRAGRVASLDHLFVDSVRPRRFRAWLFGSFALASLCVVGLGIFGQLAMATARRTREMGIRVTCGATRSRIARLILGEQLVPVVVGLMSGGLVAAWAVRFVGSYLYQVTASDPHLWIAAVGLILLTAAAGMLVPAVRTSRIDPTQALKAD